VRRRDAPRHPNGAIATRVVKPQRQTYEPFTSTRTQPEDATPTAAPPTTARRVVRRATPATLTGVNGRPTLACALSTATERPPPGDQFIEARAPGRPHGPGSLPPRSFRSWRRCRKSPPSDHADSWFFMMRKGRYRHQQEYPRHSHSSPAMIAGNEGFREATPPERRPDA
jgi:hypothetical protein